MSRRPGRRAAAEAFRSRILRHEERDPATLQPHPGNWRLHPARQRAGLSAVLREVGWVANVIVNERTGRLLDGHLRVELALEKGEKAVPVTVVDLSPEEEKIILATLDPIAALADTDPAKLGELLTDLRGTTKDEVLKDLLRGMEEDFDLNTGAPTPEALDEAEAPPPPRRSKIKPGTLFVLGRHRLLAGDARAPESYQRLLEGARVDCVWTDPPYGVTYTGKTAERLTITNDALSDEGLLELLRASFGAAVAVCKPGAAWYVATPAMDKSYLFETVLREMALIRHRLVWVKDAFVLGRSDYHYRHETIFYGWVEGGAHYFVDDRTQDSVWEIPRPKASKQHPTMKPVALVARAIRNSTRPGEVVLDPFGGSGTTLLAAEAEGRAARLLEIDPCYCDVIIERWETMTGGKAVVLEKGR